jgi:hypothetical protein
VVLKISRIGFIELMGILPKFNDEGKVTPGRILFVDFRKGEHLGRLSIHIMENQDHEIN